MDSLLQRLRQHFCKHDWWASGRTREVLGVTLGWGGRPEVDYRMFQKCRRCGKERSFEGLLLHVEVERDERDWPLDEDGRPMEISGE